MPEETADFAPPPRTIFSRDRIEYWSLIAEIIAAIAVVISLVFVGFQLRHANTIAVRDEANATMEQWSSIRRSLYQDAATAEVFAQGLKDPQTLSPGDQLRFRFMLREYAWATWHIWDRIDRELIPESHWVNGAGRDLLQILCRPGARSYWIEIRKEMPPGFPEAVDSLTPGYSKSEGIRCSFDPSVLN